MKADSGNKVLTVLFSLVGLAVIVTAAMLVIRGAVGKKQAGTKRRTESAAMADTVEFSYSNACAGVFALTQGGFTITDPSGVRILSKEGEELQLASAVLTDPAAVSNGRQVLSYDCAGRWLCLNEGESLLWQRETEENIVTASLSETGMSAVCTEWTGYKGAVTVYDREGNELYRWYCGKGYPICADVSPDGKRLAVLTMTQIGSTVTFLSLKKTDALAELTFDMRVGLSVDYRQGDAAAILLEDRIVEVYADGSIRGENLWEGERLSGCSFGGDGFLLTASNAYAGDGKTILQTFSDRGEELGKIQTNRALVQLQANGSYVAARFTDGYVVYDKNLNVIFETLGMTDAEAMLLQKDGSFVAVGDFSAEIYSSQP